MIVVCTTCQARFKVADDKIGPRGAKVRCSKCQTVFLVHRDLGVMPVEAEPPAPAPAAAPAPVASRRPGPGELDLESEPMSGVRPSGFIADPFAMPAARSSAQADPFSASPSAFGAPPDPFGGADPFGSPAAAAAGANPFGAVDPFVATVASSPGATNPAVTDLSDLIGGAPGAAGTPVPSAPSFTPPPEPSGILESGFDFDPGASPSPSPELVAPTPAPFPAQAVSSAPDTDLALAERTPSVALPMSGAPPAPMPGSADFDGGDPFGGSGMGAGDFGGPDEDFAGGPELVEAPHPPPQPVPAARDAPLALATAADAPEAAPPELASPEEGAPEEGPEAEAAAGLRRRGSRIRSVAINAISLLALLVVAAGILAAWRGLRPGAAGALQPHALFGAIGGPPPPFSAAQVRSGLFDRADAPPVLFVSGKAVSHAATAVAGLRVKVELLRKGAVVARGEGRAGAVPNPEQLYGTRDAAGVAALLDGLAAGAPASVKPGDAVPFLVAISDYPADVSSVGMHVTVESVEPGPPAQAPQAP
jgi:predicted Zn finger-like uncharacterized protein